MQTKPINTEAVRVRDWNRQRALCELDAKLAKLITKVADRPKQGEKK